MLFLLDLPETFTIQISLIFHIAGLQVLFVLDIHYSNFFNFSNYFIGLQVLFLLDFYHTKYLVPIMQLFLVHLCKIAQLVWASPSFVVAYGFCDA